MELTPYYRYNCTQFVTFTKRMVCAAPNVHPQTNTGVCVNVSTLIRAPVTSRRNYKSKFRIDFQNFLIYSKFYKNVTLYFRVSDGREALNHFSAATRSV